MSHIVGNAGKLIYEHSPIFMQSILLGLEGQRLLRQRFGPAFDALLHAWEETQWLSREELRELQDAQLKLLISHAYDTVPYYRNIFHERRLTPDDIKTVSDLPKLPILTKDDLRRNFRLLVSTRPGSRLAEGHSSGTTGSPITVLYDRRVITAHNVALWRHRRWTGFEFGHPYASLLGRVVVPITQTRPPFWRYNRPWKQLFLSAFHLTEANLASYVQAMRDHRVEALQAYPSTAYILAQYLRQTGDYLPLKQVFTSSETLLPLQREIIEERFQCKVYDCYGLAERVMYAGECAHQDGLHLYAEYGISEIVDENDEVVTDGTYARMVATGLHNYGMPLIRYDIGDMTAFQTRRCPCGRGLPLLSPVTTKAEDIVVTSEGRFVSSSVLTHPFKPMHHVAKSQIIQDSPDELLIKVVPRRGYSTRDTAVLLTEMHKRVGEAMKIEVMLVDDIPPSSSGKFRWVVSKVPLKYKQKVIHNLYESS